MLGKVDCYICVGSEPTEGRGDDERTVHVPTVIDEADCREVSSAKRLNALHLKFIDPAPL